MHISLSKKDRTSASRVTSFYRATLYVNTVFAVARCPSVRPSVRHVDRLYPDC